MPPRCTPTVSAAPTAPSSNMIAVPISRLATSTGATSSGRPNINPKMGDTKLRSKPLANQDARSCGNTAIDNGTGAIASCSRLPSSRSSTKRRIQIIKLESNATTHSIPGARTESCSGSGPKPRGNKTITSKKNSSGLITSLGDRTISIRCRSV